MLLHRRILLRMFALPIVMASMNRPAIASTATRLVPSWKPIFDQPIDRVANRMTYYFNNETDFAVFRHGTCVPVAKGSTENAASHSARSILTHVFDTHPDFNAHTMDDGNILVEYNVPAYSIVLWDLAKRHWDEIESRHRDGLVPEEVLLSPDGESKLDERAKMGLLGRAWMFLDAQELNVSTIFRAS